MTGRLDQAIRDALQDAPDGRTPVELVGDTGHDFRAVLGALGRLAAAGTAVRSRGRIGAWQLADNTGPGRAA